MCFSCFITSLFTSILVELGKLMLFLCKRLPRRKSVICNFEAFNSFLQRVCEMFYYFLTSRPVLPVLDGSAVLDNWCFINLLKDSA